MSFTAMPLYALVFANMTNSFRSMVQVVGVPPREVSNKGGEDGGRSGVGPSWLSRGQIASSALGSAR